MLAPRSVRIAVTLLELLVVIAVIAILVGLLLPAVHKVRSAADRVRCANNLKQIGLACHHYHLDHHTLPTGLAMDNRDPYPRLSWLGQLLPYLEQEALWQQTVADFAIDKNPFSRAHVHQARDRVVGLFACPTDDRVRTAWTVFSPATGLPSRVALTSYLGTSGTQSRIRDGVLFADSRTALDHITDGTSQTLLAGERPPSFDIEFGWWYAGGGQDGYGTLDSVLGVTELGFVQAIAYNDCGKAPSTFRPGDLRNVCSAFHYWSQHPNGANFVFCDGSVKFLTYSAASVLPALATRSGGEVVAWPD